MSALTYQLAANSDGAWTIVFEPDDLHLYIAFVRAGTVADPTSWIDDFLARRPQGPAHHPCGQQSGSAAVQDARPR
ncbi:hypothetical protein [Mesorhizobium sp. M0520]|uniref:hypothetical protein n=1 Tax=Mesorhizobium sp. M0520 TaxID=2956957 RepID=UPI0033353F56